MKVTLSQMRAAVQTAIRLSEGDVKLRPAEAGFLKEHLLGLDKLLGGHEAHPEITDELRKLMLADKGVVL